MNATRSFVLVQTIVLALVILPTHAHDYAPARSAPPLRASVFVQSSRSSSVETVQFHSTLVGKTLPYNVVLPGDYRSSRVTRYPVLYLLHGLTGHYSDWLTRSNVADYAAKYRMIVVMPEGNDGWYTDSASVASDKYESYFIRELMPDVQKRYRTIESRYGRGVAGLSMGGYGALKFGLKYPATFAFAGSMSGALRPASWTEEELKDFRAIRDSVFGVFGPMGSETRKANDIHQLARSASAARISSLPYFYLDCGTEDVLATDNARFAALLHEKKIAHEYRQLPGNHNWQYWNQQVQEVLRISAEKMQARPRHPKFAAEFNRDDRAILTKTHYVRSWLAKSPASRAKALVTRGRNII